MINKKTTFILGAGASMPYGFPSGEMLSTNIIGHVASILHELKGSRSEPSVLTQLIETNKIPPKFIIEFRDCFVRSGHKFEYFGILMGSYQLFKVHL